MTADPEWFRSWFGDAYLALYPHRDEKEAEDGVQLLIRSVDPGPDRLILDLACGAGRHLRAMARAGLPAVGFDLSETLLREARRVGGDSPPLVRGDMRQLPFRQDAFGTVTNFFTSFGYFVSREEDRRVAEEVARVLRPKGGFLLDYLNAPRVRATLVPEEVGETSGRKVYQRRWLEGSSVVKRIEIHRPGAETDVHYERVRLYEPEELEEILRDTGLETVARYGDYGGMTYAPDSPRVILVGRRR